MKKPIRILLDMDGTVADLYNRHDWLKDIREENPGLFSNLEYTPIAQKLAFKLESFLTQNFIQEIAIVSWTPMDCPGYYADIVIAEKFLWLAESDFSFIQEKKFCDYGTPKGFYAKDNYINILIDDNKEVRDDFLECITDTDKNCDLYAFHPDDSIIVLNLIKELR
jgi:hypothetical protein